MSDIILSRHKCKLEYRGAIKQKSNKNAFGNLVFKPELKGLNTDSLGKIAGNEPACYA